MSPESAFVSWWLLLAALLYFPVSRLIWVLSVRRLERKLSRQLDDAEREQQKNRARTISVLVCLLFSLLYNIQTIGLPDSG